MRTEVSKFALIQATSVSDAISKLTQYGPDNAVTVAGGTDVISRNKNRISTMMQQYLIDISGLGLNYIKGSSSSGFTIGATTPISAVTNNSSIISAIPVLSQAATDVATNQIQNMGTVGGDVLQEVWCPYVRNDFPCWRNGGNVCYGAIGDNRYYHSIFGGRLCYANHAGDIAPALTALGATATIQGSLGSRTVSMEELIPGINVISGRVKENTVDYNEILTEFQIPAQPSGTVSAFYKARDRGTWDFALASAAVVLRMSGSTISSASVVLGGVDVKPHRASAAESYLTGQTLTESVIENAAQKAVSDATPLTTGIGNSYRVTIANGAVRKALRSLTSISNPSVYDS
jgi:xanthine dehydrogenase YagS FAD-binding subunit